MDYTIREFQSMDDAGPQYELWLRATATLPRAWRSCLANVQYQLQHGRRYPKCRLYAEGSDGALAGYIGTHPPFEWIAAQHGPPAESLGWAIPFGFPWTNPLDEDLEASLYDRMLQITPQVYSEFQRDIYIQRFRASWSRHLEFLERRGWRRHASLPLLGRETDEPGALSAKLVPVTAEYLPLVGELSHADDTAADKFTAEDVRRRLDGGWIVGDAFWRLGEIGVFALEQRGAWAAVTLFFARPNAWDETLAAAAAQAQALGAGEIYLTIDAHESARREALEQRGFAQVDAGVYYIRDAD